MSSSHLPSVITEEWIHDAFISQFECTLYALHHYRLLDRHHPDYLPGYAAAFRKFRFHHKTIPDFQDAWSRHYETIKLHRQMMDIRHLNFDPDYNFDFHSDQERKGILHYARRNAA